MLNIIDYSEIRRLVEPALSGSSYVVAAYLFGSTAQGRRRPGSNIDIALLLAAEGKIPDRKTLLENLLPPLCRELQGDVHLLILNDASPFTCSQVFRHGRLLYVRDRLELALFRMKSVALFADFAPVLRRTQEGVAKKLECDHG